MKTTFGLLCSVFILLGNALAEDIWVTIDHARVYNSDQRIGSIIVGNPGVADVTVKSSSEFVMFGVTPGSTNITLFDTKGRIMKSLQVAVRNPSANRVVLQAGDMRYSYACTDVCEQVPTIGDGGAVNRTEYKTLSEQSATRLGAAQAATSSSSATTEQPMMLPGYGIAAEVLESATSGTPGS